MSRAARRLALLALLAGIAALAVWSGGGDESAAPARGVDAEFWDHWGDGQAELAGYRLRYPRYGTVREGTAVAIFVTEEHAAAERVKHEDPARGAGDVLAVIKLNLVQDFSTGIYDYNLMTSAFVALAPHDRLPAWGPVKVSFSSQEWCGQTYAHALFDAAAVRAVSHSYFDGEADRELRLDRAAGGLAEDALLLWARGLASPRLEPGEKRTLPLLRSLERARLEHLPLDWHRATFSRSSGTESSTVPAGSFETDVLRVEVEGGTTRRLYPPGGAALDLAAREWTFWVERAAPHRIVRWSRSDGLEAELAGSTRAPYWTMNGEGHQAALETLGLAPRPPRTP